jgi:hypothetical protein
VCSSNGTYSSIRRPAGESASADHGNGLAGLQLCVIHRAEPCHHEVHANCRGLFVAERFRLARQRGDRNLDELGVGAVARKADVAAGAPDFGADPFSGTLHDDAAEIAARRAWQNRVLKVAGDVFHVARIHRGAFDLDDGAFRVGRRGGQVEIFEYFRAAKRLELNGFHDNAPKRGVCCAVQR